mmetsp:Transcript_45517/g.102620  ORF Transcript_45517/g.102620 Transcript_45517/m.102620 type:complete len:201 (+) Transcript_45517:674-1276(+)
MQGVLTKVVVVVAHRVDDIGGLARPRQHLRGGRSVGGGVIEDIAQLTRCVPAGPSLCISAAAVGEVHDITFRGCASVLITCVVRSRASSSEKSSKRYFKVSASQNVCIVSSRFLGTLPSTLTFFSPTYPPLSTLQCFSKAKKTFHPHSLYFGSFVNLHIRKSDSTVSGRSKLCAAPTCMLPPEKRTNSGARPVFCFAYIW